jgi:hypothetical protein
MVRPYHPTSEEEQMYNDWVAELPEKVRNIAQKFDVYSLYRLKSTGHRCVIISFDEDVETKEITLKVSITGKFNKIPFDRIVFGILPDDLELCELPAPNEELGTMLTNVKDIRKLVDIMKYVIKKDNN